LDETVEAVLSDVRECPACFSRNRTIAETIVSTAQIVKHS
jgi:hypothetical protein